MCVFERAYIFRESVACDPSRVLSVCVCVRWVQPVVVAVVHFHLSL